MYDFKTVRSKFIGIHIFLHGGGGGGVVVVMVVVLVVAVVGVRVGGVSGCRSGVFGSMLVHIVCKGCTCRDL